VVIENKYKYILCTFKI